MHELPLYGEFNKITFGFVLYVQLNDLQFIVMNSVFCGAVIRDFFMLPSWKYC